MSEAPNQPLFSYGTLQQPEVQLELFDRRLERAPDVLVGFRIEPIELRDPGGGVWNHFIAIRTGDDADRVPGATLLLTPDELAAADRYEPDPYMRVEVTLASGKRAWVYEKREA